MFIRPELRALWSKDAPQRDAQQALYRIHQAWRETGPGRQVETELERFHRGEALGKLPLLAAMFCPDRDDWRTVLDSLLHPLLGQIAAEPLSQSPLRHSATDVSATVVLARCMTSALSLQHVSGPGLSQRPAPTTASFIPAETWERVLCGSGQAMQVRLREAGSDRAELDCASMRLAAGDVSCRMGQAEALILLSAPTGLVRLCLQRRTSTSEPAREYRLADGQLVHQSAGTPRNSRLELTAAVLGRMKRRDAAPMLSALVEEEGSDSLRWQVLRECLALDTAVGFRTLCTVADRPGDPLCQPARALRTRLLDLHPELDGISPCPA